MKGHDSIRGSGPLTVDRPWEAAVFEGRDCLILTSPLRDGRTFLGGAYFLP